MPSVKVNPISRISVKVNQGGPQLVKGTTTFVGGAAVSQTIQNFQLELAAISALANSSSSAANTAASTAQTALSFASTGYNYVTSGGTIGGTSYVTGNVVITEYFQGVMDSGGDDGF
jgi:hypothetical protein